MPYKPGPKELSVTGLRIKRAEEQSTTAGRRRTKAMKLLSREEIVKLQGLEKAMKASVEVPDLPPTKPLVFGMIDQKTVRAIMDGPQPKETTVKTKKTKARKAKTAKPRKVHPMIKSITSTDHKTTPIGKINVGDKVTGVGGDMTIVAKSKAKKRRKVKTPTTPIPALDVANFMARPGGASMAGLVEMFGIEAHPMRAKIHYIRNRMAGWDVELKDGRYYATFKQPK
jgi:hypothetical protein